MIKKLLLSYQWFALSLLTISFGTIDVTSHLHIGEHWNYVNNTSFGWFIIIVAIALSISYFPIYTKKYRTLRAQVQTMCIASMTFVWLSISLAYLTESSIPYIGIVGLIITSQTLVQAYIEPYRNK